MFYHFQISAVFSVVAMMTSNVMVDQAPKPTYCTKL